MNPKCFVLITFILLCIIFIFYLGRSGNFKINKKNHPPITILDVDEHIVYMGIRDAEKLRYDFSKNIYGGIVPHHLLASRIIASFFSTLAKHKPELIVIVGPNHTELGGFKVLTSNNNWQTPFGFIEANQEVIKVLLQKDLVKINNEILSQDQSIASLIPFIAHYLPESTVVPLIISGNTTAIEAIKFSNNLLASLNKKAVIIASVDFSHYLNSKDASINDQITKSIIDNMNFTELFKLNSDFLDSPPSIAVLLQAMQRMNALKSFVLDYDNSGKMVKNEFEGSTSYYSIVFYK